MAAPTFACSVPLIALACLIVSPPTSAKGGYQIAVYADDVGDYKARPMETTNASRWGRRLVVDATQAAGQCPIDVTGQTSVLVSFRKNFIRFSPHLNNDADDIQKALQALDRIIG